MIAIASGQVYSGAIVLMVARAMFAIVGPIIAARQSTDRIGAIAAYTTWSDCGLAAGAFAGILAFEWAGYSLTYAVLAAMTAVSTLWFISRPAIAPPQERA
jgi:predicted MFS family arabinose efflux permease